MGTASFLFDVNATDPSFNFPSQDLLTDVNVLASQASGGASVVPTEKPAPAKPKRKTRLCSLTPEEKGERRKQQNRLAASRCRKKKQAALQRLQSCTDDVQKENDSLKAEIAQLKKL